jgi:hypothetical protein
MKRKPINIKNEVTPKTDQSEKIESKIIPLQLTRFNKNLNDFKFAVDCWEDVNFPTRDGMIELYNDAILDGHLFAVIESIKSKTLQKDFVLKNPDGTANIEKTQLLKTSWFYKTIGFALDSIFFAHSLIQFDDRIGFDFKNVKIVPRENVDPVKKIVRTTPNVNTGTPYNSNPFDGWIIEAGDEKDAGLLMKTIPLIIYKKNSLSCWGEYSELFGTPIRIGRTNIKDAKVRDNMFLMLENMGSSAFGVFNTDDKIEFVESSKSDAFNVFDKMIDRVNSEISKIVLSSTMTVDGGSSRSQSETHESTTRAREMANDKFIEFWVNKTLIPFLTNKHNFPFAGLNFAYDYSEKISSDVAFERELKLLEFYDIPETHFVEKYGIPVVKKEQTNAGVSSVKK